jgi:hypothetical protein
MQETTNYKLKKYQGTDAPNLITGYNDSMDKVDTQMKANATAAASAASAASTADGKAVTAQGKADAVDAKLGNGFSSSNTVTAQLAAVKSTADAAATKTALQSEVSARGTADTNLQDQIGTGFSSSHTIADAIGALESGAFVPSQDDATFDVTKLGQCKVTSTGIVYWVNPS